MTEKVFIHRQDDLPCPCILLPTADALADWYHQQLLYELEHGELALRLNCFDSLGGDFSPIAGAYAVLRMAVNFLYDHSQVERLDLFCAGERCHKAYQFQWNMWFAEAKPHHD